MELQSEAPPLSPSSFSGFHQFLNLEFSPYFSSILHLPLFSFPTLHNSCNIYFLLILVHCCISYLTVSKQPNVGFIICPMVCKWDLSLLLKTLNVGFNVLTLLFGSMCFCLLLVSVLNSFFGLKCSIFVAPKAFQKI